MSIVITGGGTGGHLAIAKAIKEEFNRRDIKPIFIGSSRGQDRQWFGEDDGWIEKLFLETSGVVNKRGISKAISLMHILKESVKLRSYFKKEGIKAVLSVGGYSAAAASFAALLTPQTKLYIQEQNAVMGSLNRLLQPFATKVFSAYEADRFSFPIREIFFEKARVREDLKTVIFLGGSQGASAINRFAQKIAPLLDSRGIRIMHQCGKNDYEDLKKFYAQSGIGVELFPFSDDLISYMERADFAISRAGASTLWELTANGLPALFVPYPYAAGDHQYYNAKSLADQGLALLRREEELDEGLIEEITALDLKEISEKLKHLAKRDGAKQIVDEMLSVYERLGFLECS